MNFDPKTGTVKLHKNQKTLLRDSRNLVAALNKFDPKVTSLDKAIELYCTEEPEPKESKC